MAMRSTYSRPGGPARAWRRRAEGNPGPRPDLVRPARHPAPKLSEEELKDLEEFFGASALELGLVPGYPMSA
ncbi:MAG: hypothetical protein KJ067_11815 [Vicinamibacteria bacterium]|nr:hypothetical protein [Vicinamibacteria bacterium]